MSDHRDPHRLTGAYAAHALDPAGRAEAEAHLAACPECRQEVADMQAALARVAAASAAAPPPQLRGRVLAQVAATRQLPPVGAGARRRLRPGLPARLLAAASVVLLVLAGAAGVVAVREYQAHARMVASMRMMQEVLAMPDAVSMSADLHGGGRASVLMSESAGRAVFVAPTLAAPPPGHTYQLWLVTAQGLMTPAGTFSAPHAVVPVAGDLHSARAVGLTVEPAGGSTHPTGEQMFMLHLPAA